MCKRGECLWTGQNVTLRNLDRGMNERLVYGEFANWYNAVRTRPDCGLYVNEPDNVMTDGG